MNYYTSGYPIYKNIDGQYTIYNNVGKTLYNGYITRMPNQTFISEVDIAPVMRQLIQMPDYTDKFKTEALMQDYNAYMQNKFLIQYETSPSSLPTSGPFSNNSTVTSIEFTNGIKVIAQSFAYRATALEKVIFPASVTKLERSSFAYCENLKEVYFYGTTPPTLEEDSVLVNTEPFYGTSEDLTIYVLSSAYNAYTTAWPDLADKITGVGGFAINEVPDNAILYTTNTGWPVVYLDTVTKVIFNDMIKNPFAQIFTLENRGILDEFAVVWNYSKSKVYINDGNSWQSAFPLGGIQNYVYPEQYVVYSKISNLVDNDTQYSIQITSQSGTETINIGQLKYSFSQILQLSDNVSAVSNEEAGTVKFMRGSTTLSQYELRQCYPEDGATVYFINNDGTLSWCQFDKRFVKKLNVERNQFEQQSAIDYPSKFGITNYQNNTYYDYTLNTDWLTEGQMSKLRELFNSPAVWLQEFGSSKVISVVLTDKSYTMKTRNNDKLFNVQIKCRDSQTYNIYD